MESQAPGQQWPARSRGKGLGSTRAAFRQPTKVLLVILNAAPSSLLPGKVALLLGLHREVFPNSAHLDLPLLRLIMAPPS